MSKHLHAIQFDGTTFGMEIDTDTAAWRKFKDQIRIETVRTKHWIEQRVPVVPAVWLGAIMREAHWLVTEQRSFEKFMIEGFMSDQFIFVKYPDIQTDDKEDKLKMNNELMRNPAEIAQEINLIKSQTYGILEAAHSYAKRSCFEIGKRLEEAKAAVGHGNWGEWLESNVGYSVSTANDLMRIYREFGNDQIDMLTGKSDAETFEGLSQSQMVALFSLPKAMRAEFVEEHRDELESGDMSTRKMKEEIKRLNEIIEQKDKEIRDNDDSYGELVIQKKAAEALAKEASERADAAEAKASDLQLRFDELNEKPLETTKVTETVYEPAPEQIEEIKAAAVKDAEKKLAKAQAEVDKLKEKIKTAGAADEKKISDLESKLAAKDAEAEAKIKAAVEEATAEAKKQVRQLTAQSDPRAAKITYYLETISRAMADINSVITTLNGEKPGSGDQIRAKCEAALLKLAGTYGWQI